MTDLFIFIPFQTGPEIVCLQLSSAKSLLLPRIAVNGELVDHMRTIKCDLQAGFPCAY